MYMCIYVIHCYTYTYTYTYTYIYIRTLYRMYTYILNDNHDLPMFDAPNLQTGREDHANPSLKAPREENPKDSKQQEKKRALLGKTGSSHELTMLNGHQSAFEICKNPSIRKFIDEFIVGHQSIFTRLWMNTHEINCHFRNLNWRYLSYIRLIFEA